MSDEEVVLWNKWGELFVYNIGSLDPNQSKVPTLEYHISEGTDSRFFTLDSTLANPTKPTKSGLDRCLNSCGVVLHQRNILRGNSEGEIHHWSIPIKASPTEKNKPSLILQERRPPLVTIDMSHTTSLKPSQGQLHQAFTD